MNTYQQLDAWIDSHFDEQVRFLQALIRVPTDTPPGNNAPHAERAAELLQAMGLPAEKHPVPEAEVRAAGLQSITNLLVRRQYGPGKTVLLNAHGDVVPPGEGWTKNPYGGEIENGKIYGRAAAVSKCDFSTYAFAVRALEAVAKPKAGSVELLFTYDEEFGGEARPRLAAQTQGHPPGPDDCRRLQLPGHHRAQRLPADGSHRARQDGPRRHSRLGRGRAAGGGAHPERAVRAKHALQAGDAPRWRASRTLT